MVPRLVTALSGPINALEQHILESVSLIENWFNQEWMEHTPPFYSSVDIRDAGFKIAPVDTNLYPGGWNNLMPEMLSRAVQAAITAIGKITPQAKNLLLVPENHTRNMFYLMNVAQLQNIFSQAGFNVRLGSMNPEIDEPTSFALPNGETVTLEPLLRQGLRLGVKDFDPCAVLINNDLSAGVPGILENIHGQCVLPPLHAGWHVRRKSMHFKAYQGVAKRFGKLLEIDPWLIDPMFEHCGQVNFAEGRGMERLQTNVDVLLRRVRHSYKEYGIHCQPFAVVKADNGTYGMGIMIVRDAKELALLSRRTKNKMAVIKDGQQVSDVIIQEGVLTNERVNGIVAEPVVYMMDRYVVGGFYRTHAERGIDENLNTPGASFVPMNIGREAHSRDIPRDIETPNRSYMYGVIGRLAALAASYELETTFAPSKEDCTCA